MIRVIHELEVGRIASQEAELTANEHVVEVAHFFLLTITQIAARCLVPIFVEHPYVVHIICDICRREERVSVRRRVWVEIAYGYRWKKGLLFGEQSSASANFVAQILLDALDDEYQAANRRQDQNKNPYASDYIACCARKDGEKAVDFHMLELVLDMTDIFLLKVVFPHLWLSCQLNQYS